MIHIIDKRKCAHKGSHTLMPMYTPKIKIPIPSWGQLLNHTHIQDKHSIDSVMDISKEMALSKVEGKGEIKNDEKVSRIKDGK